MPYEAKPRGSTPYFDLKPARRLLKDTFLEWQKDQAPRLGAALAFYTLFSLAPLLIVVIAIAGLFFGQEAAQGRIVDQIEDVIGAEGARTIQSLIEGARRPVSGILASLIGVATLLLGATGVFVELQGALNAIWEVPPRSNLGLAVLIKDRLLSFALILAIGFLLIVSLVVSAALTTVGTLLGDALGFIGILQAVNFLISFAVITLLFSLIYKVLPDLEIAWSDVLLGGAATALLFTIGKHLIGFYLGKSSIASVYGAAGSVVIILLWIYYSAQILYLGAEFTQVYASHYGSARQRGETAPLKRRRIG